MTESGTDYPVARTLQLGVNRVEDRLVLIAHTVRDGPRAAWFTRRLLRQLLNRYASFLAESSPTAAQADPAQRGEILQMEHISALETGGDGGDNPGGASDPAAHFLVTEAHLQARKGAIVLALDGLRRHGDGADGTARERVCALTLDRPNAHKILDVLKRKSDEAGWDLPAPSDWTEAPRPTKADTVN
ncbi:hypothetical protein SAMN05216241_10647 [Limimonas halophila]|uniref:Uncharacterized protein n=1 Tax=Limimonas halophila TaxID=1082479 RepID=A0A1G7RYA0_9PROT|nr:hypothetical protein [Limimonas halophila]SDG15745.1 hypothetical protein SAMN05216241_10647 [Limimonas halophila]